MRSTAKKVCLGQVFTIVLGQVVKTVTMIGGSYIYGSGSELCPDNDLFNHDV